ncbi:MAG: hypothetical protein ACRDQZ_19690, partial [Mycobacteriales bacterium]
PLDHHTVTYRISYHGIVLRDSHVLVVPLAAAQCPNVRETHMCHVAALAAGAVTGVAAVGYLVLVTAAIPIDLGVGELGSLNIDITASRELVFDILTALPWRPNPRHG